MAILPLPTADPHLGKAKGTQDIEYVLVSEAGYRQSALAWTRGQLHLLWRVQVYFCPASLSIHSFIRCLSVGQWLGRAPPSRVHSPQWAHWKQGLHT